MGIVEQAIADGVGDGGVAEMVVPLCDGQLAGEDGGSVAVAILDDLEQIAALGSASRHAGGTLGRHGAFSQIGCRHGGRGPKTVDAVAFPARSDLLTPALLTRVLSEWQPGVEVEALQVVEEAHCDTGSASTAARAVLDLRYAAARDCSLPRRVVLKTVLVRPGAPDFMYRNEVRFYRDLRPELEIETPRVFASVFDDASGTFGVVMEDLRLRSALFPSAITSMNVPQTRSVLRQLAALHAQFWESPRFARELDWLWTPRSGAFATFMHGAGREFLRYQVERSEYKQELLARLGRSFDEAWDHLQVAQNLAASEPTTLLHGDTHFGNIYLLPGERVGLLDWQLVNRGRWSHDVTYMLMTGLDVESRRRHERELLAYYLDQLRVRGVATAPDFEEAWLQYRQSAIWGFLIGWMITPVENYGEAILHANLDRLTAALEDLESFAALAP